MQESDYKAQARRLRTALMEGGQTVTHSRALDLTARLHGARDWRTLLATTPPQVTPLGRVGTLSAQLHDERLHVIADTIEAHTGMRPQHLSFSWSRGEESGLPVLDLIIADGHALMEDDFAWEIPEPAYQLALHLLEDAVDRGDGGEEEFTVPTREGAVPAQAVRGVLNPDGVPAALRAERRWAVLAPNHATQPPRWLPHTLKHGKLRPLNFTRREEWLTFEDAAAHALKHQLEIGFILTSDSPVMVYVTSASNTTLFLGYQERSRSGRQVRSWFREGSSASLHLRAQRHSADSSLITAGRVVRVTGTPLTGSEADLPWVAPEWFTVFLEKEFPAPTAPRPDTDPGDAEPDLKSFDGQDER